MYYLVINGAQQGPYPLEQVQTMLSTGQIPPDSLAWTEGQGDWKPVGSVIPTSQLPPIPAAAKVARVGMFSFFGGMGLALAIVGAVLLMLLVVAGGCIGYVVYKGNELDRSSKAYVDEAIPAIATGWMPHELVKRESKAFQKATNDAQLVQLFAAFRKLGALKTYGGAKGEANINYMPDKGKMITATYIGKATFDNGDAQIRLFLVQQDGEWKIQGFRVDSPLFLK